MFTHLHVRSWYSFLQGGSSPEDLAQAAAEAGMESLALTDVNGVYGAVRFRQACEKTGITPVYGAEAPVMGRPLVLLASSLEDYAALCQLLTTAHLKDDLPHLSLEDLSGAAAGLFCLTNTYEGRLYELIDDGRQAEALRWIGDLQGIFGDRLSIEITCRLQPDDTRRLRKLERLSEAAGAPLLATGDVRYARRPDYRRYDLLTCIRAGQEVFDFDESRPKNAEAYLKSEAALRKLIPYERAFARAEEVAEACRGVDLLPGRITTPAARRSNGETPAAILRRRCRRALTRRYAPSQQSAARTQLEKELSIIADLGLSDYFLVVAEVTDEAACRGIRHAGRGSAANSITAYLLGVTGVDPLEHRLLFERFLHRGRQGAPDIDVDFDSERRDEIIDWMEERFGVEQTAMAATVVTYRLRSAVRDVGKALGFPPEAIGRLAKRLPHHRSGGIADCREEVEAYLGRSVLTETFIEMCEALAGCPRHLGLHVGGMVLSRRPLSNYTPVQRSANGVRMTQFDKDDIESLGLVKLDVLGLRMLSAVNEAEELVRRHQEPDFRLEDLPLDDIPTFNMLRAGDTIGCFQIESQGQIHLLAKHQPDCFGDLITEIALFRPGPLQGNMVNPFVRRRQGKEPVRYDHPDLKPILRDTYGIILFQEQVLEVVHIFAGMPLKEADEFRQLMSTFRDPGGMEAMRDRFMEGCIGRGVEPAIAKKVFEQVAGFVGYGFCRSHAAAFALTVYHSAYLKRHHPAAFLAAVMQHRPGMYDLQTLEEEAKRSGVAVHPPCVLRSGMRYEVEGEGRAIRKPLTSVKTLSVADARVVVLERLRGHFKDLEDFYRRCRLSIDGLENLARSGALRILEEDRRATLWKIGVLNRRLGPAGGAGVPTLFNMPAVARRDVPTLPLLDAQERLAWDLQTHGATGRHPVTLVRGTLADLEARPIETCFRIGRYLSPRRKMQMTVAGRVMLRQRPPTAHGMVFVTLEDETGFIQCVITPEVQERCKDSLRQAALIVKGALEIEGNWRGIYVEEVWPLQRLLGGYEGHPSASGGRDRRVETMREAALRNESS